MKIIYLLSKYFSLILKYKTFIIFVILIESNEVIQNSDYFSFHAFLHIYGAFTHFSFEQFKPF